jgi:Fic family protein
MEKEEFNGSYGEIKRIENSKWGTYLAFSPKQLPPKINFDQKMALAISKADRTVGKLSGVGLQLPNANLLIMPYLRKEALSSSRIEGTRISLSDLLLSEAKGAEEQSPDALEVANYVRAVNFAMEKIQEGPINLDLIKDMHKILMQGVRGKDKLPGEHRKIQNWIGPPNCKVQEANFVPPPPEEIIPLMENVISYLNQDDGMPLLIKCALMHYQFETIHPFCDGNGRIGRALIALYLCKKKIIIKPLLYISGYFETHKREYSSLLLKTNKDGKFEDYLFFFLEALTVQAEDALQRAIKLQGLREEYREKIQSQTQSNNLLRLIDELFKNPYITITTTESILKITYPTAKRLVETLVGLRILKQADESRRNKMFIAPDIFDVISV